jgi:hypothetical protein
MEMEMELVMEKAASRRARFLWFVFCFGTGGRGPGMIGIQYPGGFVRAQTTEGGGGESREE